MRRRLLAMITLVSLALAPLALSRQTDTTGSNPLLSATWERRELSGHIEARRSTGDYTYVLVEADGERTWAVIAEPLRSQDSEVRLQLYARLGRYTSRRLGQTFEPLYFATLLPQETR